MRHHESEGADGTPHVSVVAPCFNEEDCLQELYTRLTSVCIDTVGKGRYEIVLVDDGSSDSTWQQIVALSKHDPHVVGIALSRNHGHQLALSAGLSECRGERILIIDADLQDPPELLPQMLGLMDEGADVVYGQRSSRDGESWFKQATAHAFYRLINRLIEFDIPLDSGDFRLMNRRALDVLNSMPEQHRFVRGMVSWIGFKQVPLAYERQTRHAGETKYPLLKMIRLAFDAITSFSMRPLRIASYLGMAFGVMAVLACAYTIFSWSIGETVPGWTSVMTVVLMLGSAQLFVTGVMGEYVGRLYVETKRRPMFIIDRVVRQDVKPSAESTVQERLEAARRFEAAQGGSS